MKKTTIISTCCRSRLPSAVRAGAGRFLPPSSFFQRRQNSSSIHNVDPKSLYGLHLLELNGENFDIPAVPNPPAPNGLLSSTVTFSGFMPDHLDFVSAWSAHAARAHNLHCSDPIHLPTILRRWDVIKGPFAHAKTKEVFERKTYQRAVQILDAQNAEVVRKWANYVVESMPAGVDVNVEYFDWFDSAKSVEKASEELQSSAGKEAEERKALGSLPSTKELSFEEQVLRKRDEFLKLWAKNAGANKGPAKGKKGSDGKL
ncbi:hypothetical protein BJ742DRAFT_790322 [Cladochytrium replicatum]|nr:hypothetical protein BJ742DRAFT_790322 [Cladochytrium replicatum]